MRILFICEYYWPESFAAGIYLREFAEFLVSEGHDVTVQTAFPHYPEGVVWSEYKNRFRMRETRNGVKIRRSHILAFPRDKQVILRALTPLTFAISSLFSSIFNGKQDIIYTLYPILPIGFTSIILGKIKKCPVVLGVKDLSTEALIQSGKLKHGPFQRFLSFLENRLYQAADHLQVPTSNLQRYMSQKGLPVGKVTFIPDWADPSAILPMHKENSFRKEHGLEGKFVLIYSGNMGYSSELETVLDAAKILIAITDICFILVGDGAKRAGLERIASDASLTNVKFLPFQERHKFPEVLAAADLGLITLNSKFTSVASQGKMYSIMSSARPLLAVMEEEAWGADWIDTYKLGSRVNPGNSEELAKAILEWRAKPNELKIAGERGRSLLEEKYTINVCCNSFVNLFNEVRFPKL